MRIFLDGATIAQIIGSERVAAMPDRIFDLARINLVRVGCPRELAAAKDNARNVPLLIEKNRQRAGFIQATGYYPSAVVTAGDYRRRGLLARGAIQAYAWVERGALELSPGDLLGAGELAAGLSNLLERRYYGPQRPISGQPWPSLYRIHPFEGLCLYAFGGRNFRYGFTLDAQDGVKLAGDPVEVSACGGMAGMPLVQTGERSSSNPLPLASNQVSSRGGLNSDLVRMAMRNFSNVEAVVGKMVAAIKTGLYRPLKPDFAPVNLSPDGKILGPLVEAGIAPADFVCWADGLGQSYYLDARKFSDEKRKHLAKTGAAMPDGSYPIENRGDLKNAVQSFGRSPDQATKRHIVRRAKALGATDMLPEKWGATVKALGGHKRSFGGFRHTGRSHDVGGPKKVSFKV